MSSLRFCAAIPSIIIDDLPEKERPHARTVQRCLEYLVVALRQFYDALQLFDMCNQRHDQTVERQSQLAREINALDEAARQTKLQELIALQNNLTPQAGWALMSGRDGAITLYHFWRCLKAVKWNVEQGKTAFRNGIEIAKIDGAIVLLDMAVPNIKGLRDSVGHTAEMFKNPRSWEMHKSKPFQTRVFKHEKRNDDTVWLSCMDGRTFFTTAHTGDVVEYQLSDDTFRTLEDAFVRVLNAFPSSRLKLLLPS